MRRDAGISHPPHYFTAVIIAVVCMLSLFGASFAQARNISVTVPHKKGGYGQQPTVTAPETIQFSERPAVVIEPEAEPEPAAEDIAASELLHGYDVPLTEELGVSDVSKGLSLGSDLDPEILSPLNVYNSSGKVPVDRNIKMFSVNIKDRFSSWLSRSGKYVDMMKGIFREHGMPEDLVYIALIESGFNPKAYSWANASGPWQFIKSTGTRYGLRVDSWVDERRDPVKSTNAAAAYLKDLYNMFGTWSLSMAAYNSGEGNVSRAINRTGTLDFWKLSESSAIVQETREYVPKFIAAKAIAKDPAAYGLGPIDYEDPFVFDEVRVDRQVALSDVARTCGTSVDNIKGLNPELRRECTPPNTPGYRLRVPKGSAGAFLAGYAQIPRAASTTVSSRHVVRRGETLTKIASRYDVPVAELASINGLRTTSKVRSGRSLTIPVSGTQTASSEERPVTALRASASGSGSGTHVATYKVKRGDTLSGVARKYGMTTANLAELNGMSRKAGLRRGQRLKVSLGGVITASASASSSASSGSGASRYRVRNGDTLWEISRKFGVSMDSIRKANSMGRRPVIKTGQRIVIPAKSGLDT